MKVDGLSVSYDSPGNGKLQYSWKGPFIRNGEKIQLHGTKRFDNSFCQADYPSDKIRFSSGDSFLELDYNKGTKEFSS